MGSTVPAPRGSQQIAMTDLVSPFREFVEVLNDLSARTGHPVLIAFNTWLINVFPDRLTSDGTWLHLPFENIPAAISGVEANHKHRNRHLPKDAPRPKTLAIVSPDVAYDIAFQSVSGMLERWHNAMLVVLDEEPVMDLSGLRFSATPFGAATDFTPRGRKMSGKDTDRKDMTLIAARHHIPYAAQAALTHIADLERKLRKAFETEGPTFVNVLCVSPKRWAENTARARKLMELAVDTCYWSLYEVVMDWTTVNYFPAQKLPVSAWAAEQPRFEHLLHPENAALLEKLQSEVDNRWAELVALHKVTETERAKS